MPNLYLEEALEWEARINAMSKKQPPKDPEPQSKQEQFLGNLNFIQREEAFKLYMDGKTEEQVFAYLKSKQIRKDEERHLLLIQYMEEERRKLEKINRAERKLQKQTKLAQELAERFK